jgi:hypothetical protein
VHTLDCEVAKIVEVQVLKEEEMKKQFIITLIFASASFLLGALPAAAQGRSGGHAAGGVAPGAGPGAAGMHEPMGMGAAMGNHGGFGTADTHTPQGPKTPGELLSQNSKLSDNLTNLLPSGMTAQQACANFKNLGQCVAAIHVAKNLGLDFNSLECNMTLKPVPTDSTTTPATCPDGTATGSKGMSLGASIQALDPSLSKSDVKSATKTGQKQAHTDLSHS